MTAGVAARTPEGVPGHDGVDAPVEASSSEGKSLLGTSTELGNLVRPA
jgi:hypothetical protein